MCNMKSVVFFQSGQGKDTVFSFLPHITLLLNSAQWCKQVLIFRRQLVWICARYLIPWVKIWESVPRAENVILLPNSDCWIVLTVLYNRHIYCYCGSSLQRKDEKFSVWNVLFSAFPLFPVCDDTDTLDTVYYFKLQCMCEHLSILCGRK